MSSVNIIVKPEAETPRPPPRERILAAATELFYRQGIRAVGVEAIAEAAGTNKMTLYRHFASKDELVAECLRGFARHVEAAWSALAEAVPDPKARLRIWVREVSNRVTDPGDRGCALVNAAVEIPEKDHPARRVVEAFKSAQRDRLVGLCRQAGARDPAALADELFLLIEGARVCAQSMGPKGPCCQLVRLGETVLQSHGA
ncbi:MAG: TetR/AcrR family transcriptional regulator [Xanthobacteraceae bacterium]|nr:TetR/AcrR family transcriptional regulator [Xanthobacteraceae bacterium]PWB58252.1 MAG: TetR family transcriptional regulator [Bradyrhizobiaceae bacterium]